MTLARKIFISNVTLAPGTATSILSLMQGSTLYWTYDSSARTTPSMDSVNGSECGFVPLANIFVGSDSNVRAQAPQVAPNYTGVMAKAGLNFSLQDFGAAFGIIDPTQIYLYSDTGSTLDLVFTGR